MSPLPIRGLLLKKDWLGGRLNKRCRDATLFVPSKSYLELLALRVLFFAQPLLGCLTRDSCSLRSGQSAMATQSLRLDTFLPCKWTLINSTSPYWFARGGGNLFRIWIFDVPGCVNARRRSSYRGLAGDGRPTERNVHDLIATPSHGTRTQPPGHAYSTYSNTGDFERRNHVTQHRHPRRGGRGG
jgi:hypothetical protein